MTSLGVISKSAYRYRPKRNRPEQKLQIAVMEFLDLCLPSDAIAFHVPNGGGRSKAEAGIFKAMGVKPGVPDIIIFWNGKTFAFELKAGIRKLSLAQIAMNVKLRRAGVRIATAYSLDDVERTLGEWAIPLRGALAA